MKKNIFIFTAHGLSPDLYINIITHLFVQYGKSLVECITLLKIAYEGDSKKELRDELIIIRENISIQIQNLINSKVRKWDRKINDWEKSSEGFDYIKLNRQFLHSYLEVSAWLDENEIVTKVESSATLDQYLENQASNRNYDNIFDLTGAPKKDFVTISLALLYQKSYLHIFEVLRDFGSFKHQLIHEYIDNDQNNLYKYHDLNLPNYKVSKNYTDLMSQKEKWKEMIANGISIVEIIDTIKKDLSELPNAEIFQEKSKELIALRRRVIDIEQNRSKELITRKEAKTETNNLLDNLQEEIRQI
ncbi:hypothetical protein [Lewinella sp. LCG006]|uniref:hypothetical protein n=1 Tax=Lewinella sp. LCG006 TaxID=3231911 RepID=UPI0034608F1C